VLFQKTGSVLQLFLNGVLNSTGSDTLGGDTCNKSDVWMGGIPDSASAPMYLPGQYTGFQGLYSTRIYSKALSEEETYTLYKTKYNSANVGNVFYDTGQITVTNPTSVSGNYTGSFSYWDVFRVGGSNVDTYTGWTDPTSWAYSWTLQYKSTITIHQNEILCTVPAGSFNLSFNPTLRETSTDQVGCDIMSIELLKGITTHSMFNPYSTTIGLYNDRCEMIAVAKTARPIQMINNADLTFVVRLDIDAGLGGGGTGSYPEGYEPLDPIAFVCQDGECKGISSKDVVEAYEEAGYAVVRIGGERPNEQDIEDAKKKCAEQCGVIIDPPIEGCMDQTACNYNPNATLDDGSCYHAGDCKDCDGNPINTDCMGECGGSAYIDNCSNCVGGNTGMTPCEPEEEDPCDGVTFPDCIGWVVHTEGQGVHRKHWISAIENPSSGTRYGRNGDAPYNNSQCAGCTPNMYGGLNALYRWIYFTIDEYGTSQKAYEAALRMVQDFVQNGDGTYGSNVGGFPCKNSVCPCPSSTAFDSSLFTTMSGPGGSPVSSYTNNCVNENDAITPDGNCCPDTTGTGGGFISTGGDEVTPAGDLLVENSGGTGTVDPDDLDLSGDDDGYGSTGTTGTTGGTGAGTVLPGDNDLSGGYGNTGATGTTGGTIGTSTVVFGGITGTIGTGQITIGDSPSDDVTENDINGQDSGVTEGGVGFAGGGDEGGEAGDTTIVYGDVGITGFTSGEVITIGDNSSDNVTANVLMAGNTSDKGDDQPSPGDDPLQGPSDPIGGLDIYGAATDDGDGTLPVGAVGSIGDLQDQIQNPDQTYENFILTGQYSSADTGEGSNNPILTYEGIIAGNFDGDIGTQGPLEDQRKKLMVACCQRNNGEAKCCEGAGMATEGGAPPDEGHFFVEDSNTIPTDRNSLVRMQMTGKNPDDPNSWLPSKHRTCFNTANISGISNTQFLSSYNKCMGIATIQGSD
jgi:hypothetical protein